MLVIMNKNLKFSLNIFISLLTILLVSGCKTEGSKTKIGLLMSNLDIPRWNIEREHFTKRVNELGGEVLFADANSDELLQQTQAEEMIEKGVEVLVITTVNANTAGKIVRTAHNSGVKVIAYDGLILNSELDYLVGFDLDKVGELLASYSLSKKPNGNYVILNGDKSHAAAANVNSGIMKVLNPHIENNKVNIVYNGWVEGWSKINVHPHIKKVLEFSGKKIDVIIAACDAIAEGVETEMINRNHDFDLLITGQDGELAALNRMMKGTQTMSVYKPSDVIAKAAAELAVRLAKGEDVKLEETRFNGRVHVPSIILEPVIVDKSNIEQVFVSKNIHTMDEILNFNK